MHPKWQFSPSIMASKHYNYEILFNDLLAAGITAMHFDVMDASVTPGLGLNPQMIKLIPESVAVDIHIMSKDPLSLLKTIPPRKNTYVHTHLSMCPDYQTFIQTVVEMGFHPGITIGMRDDLALFKPYMHALKWVNFMSVYEIGMTNQVFADDVYQRIETFKHMYPHHYLVAVDGSVRVEHLSKLSQLVDIVVVGSLIYSATDYRSQITTLFNSIK